MTFALATQFNVFLLWGQLHRLIVYSTRQDTVPAGAGPVTPHDREQKEGKIFLWLSHDSASRGRWEQPHSGRIYRIYDQCQSIWSKAEMDLAILPAFFQRRKWGGGAWMNAVFSICFSCCEAQARVRQGQAKMVYIFFSTNIKPNSKSFPLCFGWK